MKEIGYKRKNFAYLKDIEENHFWFKIRNKVIMYFIKTYCHQIIKQEYKMLEIGCGNGIVLQYLGKNKINCYGGDIFREVLIDCRKKTDAFLYQFDASHLPFVNCFNIIGLFDVVEHIKRENILFEEVFKALKPNGKIIITVPANKKLWGRYDELALHERRYTRNELKKKLEGAGFIVERISYFISFLFPIVFLFRSVYKKIGDNLSDDEFMKKEFLIIPLLNTVFTWILEIELLFVHLMNLPFGSSLIVVARKE